MVARKLSTAKSGVLADVIGPIHFRLLQSWCLLVATGCVLLSVLTLSSTLPVASSSTTLSIATGCRSLYNFYRTLLLATGCLFLQNVGFQFSQPSCRYEPPVPSCFSRVCFYQNLCKLWLKLLVILYFFKLSEKRSWLKEPKMIDVKKIEEENIIFFIIVLKMSIFLQLLLYVQQVFFPITWYFRDLLDFINFIRIYMSEIQLMRHKKPINQSINPW